MAEAPADIAAMPFEKALAELEQIVRSLEAGNVPLEDARWKRFAASYRREMSRPPASRTLDVLARLSHSADFSVGCYCEDFSRCHRSVLKELLAERGASMAADSPEEKKK